MSFLSFSTFPIKESFLSFVGSVHSFTIGGLARRSFGIGLVLFFGFAFYGTICGCMGLPFAGSVIGFRFRVPLSSTVLGPVDFRRGKKFFRVSVRSVRGVDAGYAQARFMKATILSAVKLIVSKISSSLLGGVGMNARCRYLKLFDSQANTTNRVATVSSTMGTAGARILSVRLPESAGN